MKKLFFWLLLVFAGLRVCGQTNIRCNEKIVCTMTSEDSEDCTKTIENNTFQLDKKETIITQQKENYSTTFQIDSKYQDTISGTLTYTIHAATGEKLKFIIATDTIKMQSLSDSTMYLTYTIKQ